MPEEVELLWARPLVCVLTGVVGSFLFYLDAGLSCSVGNPTGPRALSLKF